MNLVVHFLQQMRKDNQRLYTQGMPGETLPAPPPTQVWFTNSTLPGGLLEAIINKIGEQFFLIYLLYP